MICVCNNYLDVTSRRNFAFHCLRSCFASRNNWVHISMVQNITPCYHYGMCSLYALVFVSNFIIGAVRPSQIRRIKERSLQLIIITGIVADPELGQLSHTKTWSTGYVRIVRLASYHETRLGHDAVPRAIYTYRIARSYFCCEGVRAFSRRLHTLARWLNSARLLGYVSPFRNS